MSFQLTDQEYETVRRLVYEYSRIDLGEKRRELVAARLGKRLKATGLPDYASYCAFLTSPQGAQELTHLVDAISTNHTFFFRELKHFEFLRETILPAYVQNAAREGLPPVFRTWSAGCASGEEPYSIAIFLDLFFRSHPQWSWQVEATDISTRILGQALQGIYPADRLREVQPDWLPAYFQKGIGSREGQFRVKESVRRHVLFQHLNLLQGPPPFPGGLPLIWCRNVMIYFDQATQQQLLEKLSDLLMPGGYLFIGHSESLAGVRHNLRPVRPAIYRKA
ncbi:MAG: protein-glutamate O-methyltransferase CheR [Verrucomicrobium sp.]|nr:protein-glutamate O-methyltransferase CheR [Verrucomicrobium sp.]